MNKREVPKRKPNVDYGKDYKSQRGCRRKYIKPKIKRKFGRSEAMFVGLWLKGMFD